MSKVSGLLRGASVAAVLACSASAGLAADLGAGGGFKDEPAMAPLWQGFYIGVNGGGAVDGQSVYDFNPGVPAADSKNAASLKGLMGGVQAGYNAQYGYVVGGIELDADFAKTDNPTASYYLGGSMNPELNSVYSARARLGFLLQPRVLFYGTGGYAAANADFLYDAGFGNLYKDSGTLQGWVAGGGIEYMHSSHLSFGLELLHYDFGSSSYNLTYVQQTGANVIPADINTELTTVRARISFHID